MNNFKKGFTLIELLVVVSIIGILTTLLSANLNAARERARDAQRKSDLRNIQTAIRLYYNDNAVYPPSITFNSEWKVNDIAYMSTVPDDPLSPNQNYTYTYDVINDTYILEACLENKSDPKCVPGITEGELGDCSGCLYRMIP